jgi:hypothetical protein
MKINAGTSIGGQPLPSPVERRTIPRMRLNHTMRFKKGYMPIVEAVEGHYLLGGRMVQDGPVFDRFCEALYGMNEWITLNQQEDRTVKSAGWSRLKGWCTDSRLNCLVLGGVGRQALSPPLTPMT